MNLSYQSTRGGESGLTASQAILKGLADDGGLFMPVEIPKLDIPLKELYGATYQETAYQVMKLFFTDFTEEELRYCINHAYDEKFDTEEIAPLVKADGAYYLELFHGKTIEGYGTLDPSISDDDIRKEESGKERHRDPDGDFR